MAKAKKMKIKKFISLGIWMAIVLFPFAAFADDDPEPVAEKEEPAGPQSELEKMKKEWEAVREQQIQMIREKEDQLEKLKEEIFTKMKASGISVASPSETVPPTAPLLAVDLGKAAAPGNSSELEAQKAALRAERQKFFSEMNRQKESLLQLQASLDVKSKQLEAERERFEQEKKTAASQG